MLFCLIIYYLLFSTEPYTSAKTVKSEERTLLADILSDYDLRARPVLDSSKPINVKFGITPIQIVDLDEVNQVFSLTVWLQLNWIDEYLSWNPLVYNNLTKIRIPQTSIWLPDIVLYNSAEDYTEAVETKLTVEHSGNVFWGPPARFRATCEIDVEYFPFDVQTCSMKFSSWMYDGHQLNLSTMATEVSTTEYIPNGEWLILTSSVERNSVIYDCCPEPYPFITYRFTVKRRIRYYLFNVILPCLWLCILSVMTFLLPPGSGEKITLGITVLLAFSVFMLLIAENMPKTSEAIPLLGMYLFVTMSLTSTSIVLTILVLQVHHIGPHQRQISSWLKTLVFNYLAKILLAKGIVSNFVKQETIEDLFLHLPASNMEGHDKDLKEALVTELAAGTISAEPMLKHIKLDTDKTRNNNPQLESVTTKGMKRTTKTRKRQDVQQIIGDEWHLLAIILDRLFFCVYIIATAIASLVILVFRPLTVKEP